ncbi:hypothetical protein TNCV_4318121 [Trichonephila clavipes]|nr:hypothetical protein TNCV_4318121 [Trichonephila clavipes]
MGSQDLVCISLAVKLPFRMIYRFKKHSVLANVNRTTPESNFDLISERSSSSLILLRQELYLDLRRPFQQTTNPGSNRMQLQMLSIIGILETIITDEERNFKSNLFCELSNFLGTTAYPPVANRLVAKFHK